MSEDNQDKLARALATLMALRNNVANMSRVDEVFIQEYHHVLDQLEGVRLDIKQFRIPVSEVKPEIESQNYYSGETYYSEGKYVSEHLFLTKLDSVIGYLRLRSSKEKPQMGFSPPGKQ